MHNSCEIKVHFPGSTQEPPAGVTWPRLGPRSRTVSNEPPADLHAERGARGLASAPHPRTRAAGRPHARGGARGRTPENWPAAACGGLGAAGWRPSRLTASSALSWASEPSALTRAERPQQEQRATTGQRSTKERCPLTLTKRQQTVCYAV